MTKLVNSKYEDLIVPNTFWCTFQEGKTQQEAMELGNIQSNFKYGDQTIVNTIEL